MLITKIAIFLSLVFLLVVFKLFYTKERLDFIGFILVPWIFVFVFLLMPFMRGTWYDLQPSIILYVFLHIIFIASAYIIGNRITILDNNAKSHIYKDVNKIRRSFNKCFFVISILTFFSLFGDFITKLEIYRFDLSNFFISAEESRDYIVRQMARESFERSLFQKFSVVGISNWPILLVSGLLAFESLNRGNRFMLFLVLFIPIWLSISVFGRSTLVISIVLIFITAFVRKKIALNALPKLGTGKVNVLYVLICFGICYSLILFLFRIGYEGNVADISYGRSITYEKYLIPVLDSIPIYINKMIYFALYYVLSPVYNFAPMLIYGTENIPGPFYYLQLPPSFVSLVFSRIFGFADWQQLYLLQASYFHHFFQPAAIFRTAFSSFILDYGIFGSFLFTFGFGFIMGRLTRKFNLCPTLDNALLPILLCAMATFFILYSPLSGFFYPISLSVIYLLLFRKRFSLTLNLKE